MSAIGAGRVFGAGFVAARRAGLLVVPLFVAEALAAVAQFLPVFLASAVVGAVRGRASAEALPLDLLSTFLRPGILATLVVALVFVTALAWLLRSLAAAATIGGIGAVLEGRAPSEGVARALFAGPERWLSAALVSVGLRAFALVAAISCVALGMDYFVAHPGPFAALLMTVATSLVVSLPLVEAALEVGVVRAVLTREGPFAALGGGLVLAFRQRGALVPVWATFVFAEILLAIGTGVVDGTLGSIPVEQNGQFWLLGARAVTWVASAFVVALLALVRLGAYSALVELDRAPPPPPPPPAPVVVEAEAIVDAIAVDPLPDP